MKTVAQVCSDWGLREVMRDPERWLAKQIKSGRVTARKIGRQWLFTAEDEVAALEVFASARPPVRTPAVETPAAEAVTPADGLSRRSARRRIQAVVA